MVLLRRVIGDALRARRQGQHRTLREVSSAANVSLGYLSEIERGQKEPSSELLAAICDALGARLSELLRDVSDTVELTEQLPGVLVPAQDRPATGREARMEPGAEPAAPDRSAAGPAVADPTVADPAVAEPARAEPAREPVSAVAARQPALADGLASRPVLADSPASRPALADTAVRGLADGGVRQVATEGTRQVATDGTVSVTVRQDSPLKTTLRTTRRIRSTGHDRDIICAV